MKLMVALPLMRALTAGLAAVALGSAALRAQVSVGYFTDFYVGSTGPAAGITTAGGTPVPITDITVFDFSTVEILVINQSANSPHSSELMARAADLATFVQAGGILLFHDRYVGDDYAATPNTLLPGIGNAQFFRDFDLDDDIDFLNAPNLLTNGPFGVLDNTSLDGGNSSTHGYVLTSTLPANTTVLYTVGSDHTKAAGFAYPFGNGIVFYSTIPLDHYLDGSGPALLNQSVQNIYYPNLLAGIAAVPEPSTWAMLGLGLLVVGWQLRRRQR
ncbi:MAG: PEP-CTERM sorting domain-containing protein [Opitutaceae bacterium]|nr:PEP-CTERM sorting domain-containing protein [Opitutaceae bacterium]